jgi:hypothetical protein
MRRKNLLLIAWLAGILFPVSWLRLVWPGFRAPFDAVFAPEWMHILSHLVLFAGLGALLAVIFNWNSSRLLRAAVVILAAGVLQEILQALSSGNLLRYALFDLGVDLVGGLAGLGAAWLLRGWRRRSSAHTGHPGRSD